MDVAEALIETYRLMERSGKTPSIRLAMRFVRDLGFSVTNDKAYATLRKFTEHRRSSTEQTRSATEHDGAENEHKRSSAEQYGASTEQVGASAEHLHARGKGIPNPKKPTSVGQTPLPLDRDRFAKEREIVNALWERIGSIPGKTKTGWREENIKFVRDMLAAGSDTEQILTAHLRASERTGRVVTWLKIVQDQIGRDARPAPVQRPSLYSVAEIK